MTERKYKHVLFDLDGTVTDPAEGITNSIMYALEKFGIQAKRENLLKFIGPPLRDSFRDHFCFSPDDVEKAVKLYREYFVEKGMFENEVYGGIPELLGGLKNQGFTVSLATLKPEPFAVKILEHFGIIQYFDHISGNILEVANLEKRDIIARVMEDSGASPVQAVMIGDRKYDIIGARENSMDSIAVTYGYGDSYELSGENPTYMANSVDEIGHILSHA